MTSSILRHTLHPVHLTLNQQVRSGHAHPRLLLTDFLRHELGATGTHVGCEHGACGACTVRVDGVASRACLMLAVQVDGRQVDTVEGLGSNGALNDLQAAFKKHFALQCGFCTAGILMSCADWLEQLICQTQHRLTRPACARCFRDTFAVARDIHPSFKRCWMLHTQGVPSAKHREVAMLDLGRTFCKVLNVTRMRWHWSIVRSV